MARTLSLGNGNMLVCLGFHGSVKDVYFPYVGLENHVSGKYKHKIGVYCDSRVSWLDGGEWQVTVRSIPESMGSDIEATNKSLNVRLSINDTLYNESNVLIRRVSVVNEGDHSRSIKVYFYQQFELYESFRGDTVFFDPGTESIIHYKGRRVFLINSVCDNKRFDDYAVGLFDIEGKEGSIKDAEDGQLSQNSIEHGHVDSILGHYLEVPAGSSKTIHYWLVAGESIEEARIGNSMVLQKTPNHIENSTRDYWHAWVNNKNIDLTGLPDDIVREFKQSLLMVKAHVDSRGAVIASSDSEMLQYGRDTYSYMWPRDASYAIMALDKAGDSRAAERYFDFIKDVLTTDGYLMHKYRADRSLGSSWHSWIKDGKRILPIQEDETAVVLHALHHHYTESHDIEFVEDLYNPLVKKMADFLVGYRDQTTKLPKPSYDIWEEKYLVSTYTSSSVYGGLVAAAKLAETLGKKRDAAKYHKAADEVREAILGNLYDPTLGYFIKGIEVDESGKFQKKDPVIDSSSIFGLHEFGVLPPADPRLLGTANKILEKLVNPNAVSGISRYEEDMYYRKGRHHAPNPWIITTLWLADHLTDTALNIKDLDGSMRWLIWAVQHANSAGVMSEQLDCETGITISAAPLVWSHAQFVLSVLRYKNRLKDLQG